MKHSNQWFVVLLLSVLAAALCGCGGHERLPDGSGSVDPCPPYCQQ